MEDGRRRRVLFLSPNWLGDAIMAMPAFSGFVSSNPDSDVCVLARTGIAELWRMNRHVRDVLEIKPGNIGTFAAVKSIRKRHFDRAIIIPNSFRSALTAALGCIPLRRGTIGQLRGFLINEPVRLGKKHNGRHQALEYMEIAGVSEWNISDTGFEPPICAVPSDLDLFGSGPSVCIVPGAARGESKRWPYFAEAAKMIREKRPDCRFFICGSEKEHSLCAAVAEKIGGSAADLSGRTNLRSFASILAHCSVALCNDSGGMHLASAAGAPVIAVFGLTDPVKTGPIGRNAIVICPEGNHRSSRRISRNDPEAVAALASIRPERVSEAALERLRGC